MHNAALTEKYLNNQENSYQNFLSWLHFNYGKNSTMINTDLSAHTAVFHYITANCYWLYNHYRLCITDISKYLTFLA